MARNLAFLLPTQGLELGCPCPIVSAFRIRDLLLGASISLETFLEDSDLQGYCFPSLVSTGTSDQGHGCDCRTEHPFPFGPVETHVSRPFINCLKVCPYPRLYLAVRRWLIIPWGWRSPYGSLSYALRSPKRPLRFLYITRITTPFQGLFLTTELFLPVFNPSFCRNSSSLMLSLEKAVFFFRNTSQLDYVWCAWETLTNTSNIGRYRCSLCYSRIRYHVILSMYGPSFDPANRRREGIKWGLVSYIATDLNTRPDLLPSTRYSRELDAGRPYHHRCLI